MSEKHLNSNTSTPQTQLDMIEKTIEKIEKFKQFSTNSHYIFTCPALMIFTNPQKKTASHPKKPNKITLILRSQKEKNGAEVFTKWVQTLERFRGGKDRKTH